MVLSSFCRRAVHVLLPAASAAFLCVSLSSDAVAVSPDGIFVSTRERMNNIRIVDLINTYRARNGLTLLRPDGRLGLSTSLKVKDMISQSYFDHTNPEGQRFSADVRKARYDYRSVAEVLAKGCRSEAQVLKLWSKSPTHKEALLNPGFVDVNCSNSISGGITYVACHLAKPRMIAESPFRRYRLNRPRYFRTSLATP
jgi:uncharacterized protein YkwD